MILRYRCLGLLYLKIITFHSGFRSVVVITSASHAEGRRFEPGRKHSFSSVYLTSDILISLGTVFKVNENILKYSFFSIY